MPFSAAHPALAQALTQRGYTDLTPVQTAVLAPGTEARDLLVSAQTGSGKTVAYGLAFAATLLGAEHRFAAAGNPLALIVAPTPEPASCPASAAWTRSAKAAPWKPAAISLSAPPAASVTTWRAAASAWANCAWSCWTRPTKCSTSASATSSTS